MRHERTAMIVDADFRRSDVEDHPYANEFPAFAKRLNDTNNPEAATGRFFASLTRLAKVSGQASLSDFWDNWKEALRFIEANRLPRMSDRADFDRCKADVATARRIMAEIAPPAVD